MDSMDTEWLNGIKEQVKQKVGATLKEESWTNFVEKVAWWLHAEKRRNDRIIIDAAAGLIKYGIMEEGDLIDVDNDKTELRKALEAKGVPPIVCDMLFNKYVPQQQEDGEWIRCCSRIVFILVDVAHLLGHLICHYQTKSSQRD